MEIVYFVCEFPPFVVGGLGTYAEYMSRELIKMGHDVTAFTLHTQGAPVTDVYKGVDVHRPITDNIDIDLLMPMFIPEEVRKWSKNGREYFGDVFLYNVLSANKLVNDLVRINGRKIDLIVSHDWLGSIGGLLASKGLNKPLVFHVHSTEQGRSVNGGSDTLKRLEMIAAENAQRIVTVSFAMRDHLIQLGYEESKIRVVYNGIDIDKYNPGNVSAAEICQVRANLGIKSDEYFILFVGRLNWVKGADVLLQSMSQILIEIPKAKLVILGVGEQLEMLKQNVVQFGLEGKVTIKPEFLLETEKIKYYAASDICVFPSKYEPFGIVCLEAMAMGKPVVVGARDISGLREQVISTGPTQCGFHINPYDSSDIAKFVVALLEDADLRKKCGVNARKRVIESFTWTKIAADTIRVYNELV